MAFTVKRVFAWLLCLSTFLASSCFAWDEYSFIGNPVEDVITWYDLPQVAAFSLDDGLMPFVDSPSHSANLIDLYQPFSYSFISYNLFYFPAVPGTSAGGITIPGIPAFYAWFEQNSGPFLANSFGDVNTGSLFYAGYSFTPSPRSGADYHQSVLNYFKPFSYDAGTATSPPAEEQNGYFDVSFDISSLGSFNSFDLDGGFLNYFYSRNTSTRYYSRFYDLLVNGAVVHRFYPNSRSGSFETDPDCYAYFNHFIFDGTIPISSISIRCYPPLISYSSNSITTLTGTVGFSFSDAKITVLVDDDIFLGHVDDAQNNINQYESESSQWIGSMSSNFAQLSMGSFSLPTNLSGAAALLTGIFNDVWVAMGDYKVIYVFPLFLGIALVLIGRIAKYAAAGHSHGYGADKGADG